jgi:hypothetical protein
MGAALSSSHSRESSGSRRPPRMRDSNRDAARSVSVTLMANDSNIENP